MSDASARSTGGAADTGTDGERIAAIEAIIAGRDSARYWDDPGLQRDYRDLLAARAGASRADDASHDVGARRDDASPADGAAPGDAHDSDGDERRDAHAAVGPRPPLPPGAARQAIAADPAGAALVETWDRRGGAATHIARVQETAQSALRLTADPASVIAGFDALPGTARAAVFAELAGGPPGYAAPASNAALAHWTASPEGAELVRAWGTAAARRIGIFNTRARHILRRLPDDDAAAVLRWFDGLDGRTAKAVMLALTR